MTGRTLSPSKRGKGRRHDRTVLEHVGDAGGTAEIVFQDVDRPVRVAHQVGAGDVAPDTPRRVDADALGTVTLGRFDHFRRHDAVPHDLPVVVHVVDEEVQRLYALLEPALDLIPGVARDDPRDDVEREDPFRARLVAVDGEGDAGVEQRPFGRLVTADELAVRQPLDPLDELSRLRPWRAVRQEHLVVEALGVVGLERHGLVIKQELCRYSALRAPRRCAAISWRAAPRSA